MKAVFLSQKAILRDSHIEITSPQDPWTLVPATLEAIRLLAKEETLVLLYGRLDNPSADPADGNQILTRIVRQIESAGGRVDATINCPHNEGEACGCWFPNGGILTSAREAFGLNLESCYLIGDGAADAHLAQQFGVRPIILLGSRSTEEVLGKIEIARDFPVAADLTTAVRYVEVEEEINSQLGYKRAPMSRALSPSGEIPSEQLPKIGVHSKLAQSVQAQLNRSRIERHDLARWLAFFTVGGVGLSLGIAYLLTHLYREQPFPRFAYYLTLQFIPRVVRGILFIAWGLLIIALAIRQFYRSSGPRR